MINAINISSKNREKKYNLFIEKIQLSKKDTILDVGFNNNENSPVENYLEKNYPYLTNITALGIGEADIFKQKFPEVKTIIYDGNIFSFKDKEFDIVWSNAVIEHVGNEMRQIQFLKELNRTGKKVYFTTPNRWFPFEVHTRLPLLHWLPKRVFDLIISKTRYHFMTGDYYIFTVKKEFENTVEKSGNK